MREEERQRQILLDALDPFVDEEIEVAHYAMREYGFEDSWRKGLRWIRRRFPSDHPKDRTGTYNVVAVTPTRVLVFNAKPEPPLLAIRRQIAEWPLGEIRVTSKGESVESHYNSGSSMSRHRIVRARFSWDGEERPLVLDFPKGAQTKAVLDALRGG
jgi:hypothetical protein